MARGARSSAKKRAPPQRNEEFTMEDMDDEVDEFHNQKDKLNVDLDDLGMKVDESEEDEAVLALKDSDESSEEEDDEEGDDDDDDDNEISALEAKLLKQQKYLQLKSGGVSEDEDDDEEAEEEEDEKLVWGDRKKQYYSADNVDYEIQFSDEEGPKEEEKEVKRLYKKMSSSLKKEDYEQYEEEEEEDDDDEEQSLQEAAKNLSKKDLKSKKTNLDGMQFKGDTQKGETALLNGLSVETIVKNVELLSEEEKMNTIITDAPELIGLIEELKSSMDEIRLKLQPLLSNAKERKYVTSQGLSYLETKYLLLLSYCASIVFYLLLKSEGKSVKDHPVIARLVEIRLYIEKIRPIDKKLQYQIDRLLKSGIDKSSSEKSALQKETENETSLQYRPNPNLLVPKLGLDDKDAGGVYRPPMITPTAMEDEKSTLDKDGSLIREKKKRMSRSAFIKQLADELEGRPQEIVESLGLENKEMEREKERLRKRAEAEENMFTRVPLSKKERMKLKSLKKNQNMLSGMLDDFDDDVGDLLGDEAKTDASKNLSNGVPENLLTSKKISQTINEVSKSYKMPSVTSGDRDIPVRPDLGERRRMYENQQIKTGKKRPVFDEDTGNSNDEDYEEPNEFGDGFDVGKKSKKNKKETPNFYSKTPAIPLDDNEAEGKRAISMDMEKNRGLTPHRNKEMKNPRKKYKLKHAKAVVRRKGQVKDVKRELAPYGGEASGIKSNVSHSVRLGR